MLIIPRARIKKATHYAETESTELAGNSIQNVISMSAFRHIAIVIEHSDRNNWIDRFGKCTQITRSRAPYVHIVQKLIPKESSKPTNSRGYSKY